MCRDDLIDDRLESSEVVVLTKLMLLDDHHHFPTLTIEDFDDFLGICRDDLLSFLEIDHLSKLLWSKFERPKSLLISCLRHESKEDGRDHTRGFFGIVGETSHLIIEV